MLKEKCNKAKKFVKEHKTEILTGTICVGTTLVLGYVFKKHTNEMKALINKQDNKVIENINNELKWRGGQILDVEIRLDDMYDIANNSLIREENRIKFEIAELRNFIDNLDHTKNINKFHRIPEKEAMINELEKQLKDITFDKNKIQEIMELIWK